MTVVAENKQYAEMRAKWKMRLLGTTQYDNDADVQQYRAQIATESLALWQTLNQAADREYLWERNHRIQCLLITRLNLPILKISVRLL